MYHKASGRMWLVQDHDCAHEDTGNPCAPKNWFVERSEKASVLSEAERRETADMFKLHAQGKWGLNGLILPESKEKNISKNRRHGSSSKARLRPSQALGREMVEEDPIGEVPGTRNTRSVSQQTCKEAVMEM